MALDLGVAASCGFSSFHSIAMEIVVDGLDGFCVLSFEVIGLVLCPDKAGGNGCLGDEVVNITVLGDDTGGVVLADVWYGGQSVRYDLELLHNSLVLHRDLAVRNMAMVIDMD